MVTVSGNQTDFENGILANNVVLYGSDNTPLVMASGLPVNTELPAARLAADNLALPTAPDVLAVNMVYDGTSLDLLRGGTHGDTAGAAVVSVTGTALTLADGVSNSGRRVPIDPDGDILYSLSLPHLYSEDTDTWERERGNIVGSLYGSAARTATPAPTADQTNRGGKYLHVRINVSVVADTPSVVFTIQGKDDAGGGYYDLLVSPAITSTGLTVLKVGPGFVPVANGAAADMIPRTWRVIATHGDADSITYSVGYALNR